MAKVAAAEYHQDMDVDQVLRTMKECDVAFLLIGGMNYLLRHEPVLTFDIDLWIDDAPGNRRSCERALGQLDAEWGRSDEDWGPVSRLAAGWLDAQPVFCLNSPFGAIDIFRFVAGLTDWSTCRSRAVAERTAGEVEYWGLCDADMLQCQLALDERHRRTQRVAALERILKRRSDDHADE